MVKVVILAGGKGTRLASVINHIPKPMAEINGKPFLELLIKHLLNSELPITEIILSVSYKAEIIQDYFKSHPQVKIFDEGEPKGTGGAIKAVIDHYHIAEDILVLNGDSFNLFDLVKFYKYYKNSAADIAMLVSKVDNVSRYGSLNIDPHGRIIGFYEKSLEGGPGIINNGIYFINPQAFIKVECAQAFSFELDFLMKFYSQLHFITYQGVEYFIDFGIPEDYERAKIELPLKLLVK